MNISVPELSRRFLRALDSNYNVVDEKSVYEIISTLENTRVTRELLEATRLAKHINELRRKTTDQVLARRSKSLLKRWREMLLPATPNAPNAATTPVNAQTPSRAVQASPAKTIAARAGGQNGALVTPRGPGRPPKNPQPPPQMQQQSSLSLHNNSSNNNSNSGSNNVHKLAAFSQQQQQKHKENHVNNNSLRVPNAASTSMVSGIRPLNQVVAVAAAHPTEIINLTDDRSNSPSMFQQYQQRLQQQQQQQQNYRSSPSKKSNRMDAVVVASSANHMKQQNFSNSVTSCDNNLDYENNSSVSGTNFLNNSNSNSSRKHKKHKKEKRELLTPAKTTSLGPNYNHTNALLAQMDDHSAPNLMRDDNSLLAARTSNSLILPDNDSLSNTSASLFNNFNSITNTNAATGKTTPTPAGALSFAGHFSKAATVSDVVIDVDSLPLPKMPNSRSVSPSVFHASPHASNHSIASGITPLNVDNDVIIVNHNSSDVPVAMPSATPTVDTKIPKKRGRKKGSKGIDSLLATQNEGAIQQIFNADSFSDLKQKITSISGHKKVKTTKEILSDIQNKRSASGSTVTSPSVTQAPSPESAMSEISHHSQTSTRAVTPEPSTSTGVLHPSSTEDPSSVPSPAAAQVIAKPPIVAEDVELTIKRLLSQLPPLPHETEASDSENEDDVLLPKCTCTLREVKEDEDPTSNPEENSATANKPVNIEINIIKDSDEEMADAAERRLKQRPVKKRKREKVVKSIFDLDDDNEEPEVGEMSDSEDDLESVPEETAPKDVIAVLAAGESLSQSHVTPVTLPNVMPTETDPEALAMMPVFAKYEAVIDPDCAAMRFYETDRNEVTNYHITALHNRFVPNVNGNWSHAIKSEKIEKIDDVEDEDAVSIDTANRVVPRYNFLVCDKIPKQFPDFHFDYKTFKEKCRKRVILQRIEARLAKRARMKARVKVEDTEDEIVNGETQLLPIKKEEPDTEDVEMRSPEPVGVIESSSDSSNAEDEADNAPDDVEMLEEEDDDTELPDSNNHKLPSFNEISTENETGTKPDTNEEFSEWYQSVQAVSSGEDLIILPYVVID
ncbi:mediator of RNA polymerase II transcription subunit 26 [Culicoides brevitarsis]|uniref:mediator of RNA polymerase II transcription subunit 26 n=1 Tax=Culicoides brevitarsis TaxID=469753 RepID=UPI00307B97EA